MATCKQCLFYPACPGYLPTDLDKDVFDLCAKGRADEIPDIDERCSDFKLDHYAQLAAAWDEFKKALWSEITESKIGKFVLLTADKLEAFLERFSK